MRVLKLVIILSLFLIVLSGCWDSVELEEQFLVWGMGWDIDEENPNLMTLTLSAPSTTEGAPEPYIAVSSSGYSVEEGRKNIQKQLQYTIEMGHLRVLVISEDFAKQGILKFMDSLGRNPRIGRETKLVVTAGKAKDLWDLEHPSNLLPADYLVELLKVNAKQGITADITFRDFFEAISNEGQEPVTSFIRMSKDAKMFNAAGLAVFKEDKMIGKLMDIEVQAFQFIIGKCKNGTITVGESTKPGSNSITFCHRRGGSKVKTEIINGEPHIYLKVELEGDISEYTADKPTVDEEVIEKAETAVTLRVKKEVEKVIEKAQKEFESDIFGFGLYFKAYHNNYWKSHDWAKEFPEANVHVDVRVKIRRIGIES